MIEKIKPFADKYMEIANQMCTPQVSADLELYRKLIKEQKALEEYKDLYDKYLDVITKQEFAQEIVDAKLDEELTASAEKELVEYNAILQKLKADAQVLLLPRDKNDNSDVYLEVRPAAGGDEASLFGAELFKMYQKYAEKQGWRVQILEYSETEVQGLKGGVMLIEGNGVYKQLKWESGVHRVQRVPVTESQGRVHTSTVTVAVLPEIEDVDFELDEKDIRVDVYRSGGCGGQGVNTTDSAVRLTHIPSGIVVTCQDERSQIKNKDKAMKILRAKLQDMYTQKAISEHAEERKTQIGSGDRSERIRTYNFPQDRITDHRIGYSMHSINYFMLGDIQEMINQLNMADTRNKLENINSN